MSESIGDVWAWGSFVTGSRVTVTGMAVVDRSVGQMPKRVVGLSNVTNITATLFQTYALTSAGTVWAWGDNSRGELGDGTTATRQSPVLVEGLADIELVEAGSGFAYALRADGTVWGWGRQAELTWGRAENDRHRPAQVPGLDNVRDLAVWGSTVLALRSDGSVWSWGANHCGQLGDGTTTGRLTPMEVPNVSEVTSIALGPALCRVLRSDGTVWSWGLNGGELGDGTEIERLTPVQAVGLTDVTAISAESIALRSDGTVWAWGRSFNSSVEKNTSTSRLTPAQLPNLTEITAIAGHGPECAYAIKSDGTLWSWGEQPHLGVHADGGSVWGPTRVPGLQSVRMVALGEPQLGPKPARVLQTDGTVWEWGDETTPGPREPRQVPGLAHIAGLTSSGISTFAIQGAPNP